VLRNDIRHEAFTFARRVTIHDLTRRLLQIAVK